MALIQWPSSSCSGLSLGYPIDEFGHQPSSLLGTQRHCIVAVFFFFLHVCLPSYCSRVGASISRHTAIRTSAAVDEQLLMIEEDWWESPFSWSSFSFFLFFFGLDEISSVELLGCTKWLDSGGRLLCYIIVWILLLSIDSYIFNTSACRLDRHQGCGIRIFLSYFFYFFFWLGWLSGWNTWLAGRSIVLDRASV